MAAPLCLCPRLRRPLPPLHRPPHPYPTIYALLRCLCGAGPSRLPCPPSPAGPTHVPRGLRPRLPPDAEGSGEEDGDDEKRFGEAKKSRNEKKREAKRAMSWGMELAKFKPPAIKKILRAVSVDMEVFEAVMLVKRLGPHVRQGKRRQFNYIGKLLRDVQQPELMDSLIQASKDHNDSKLKTLMGPEIWSDEDDDEELDFEEECQDLDDAASRWFDGLINRDSFITNEVYSLYNVEFDRQGLRKLVQKVHKSEREGGNGAESVASVKARKSLLRFLRRLARQSLLEA